MAKRYLPKSLEDYREFHIPSGKDLVEVYDAARDRVDVLDDDGRTAYASKCGAGIFAGHCSRFDALYTLGMCVRCLTFPTTRMDAAIDRCIAYTWRRLRLAASPTRLQTPSTPECAMRRTLTPIGAWLTVPAGRVILFADAWCMLTASGSNQFRCRRRRPRLWPRRSPRARSSSYFHRGLLAEMGLDMSEPTTI